MDKVQFCPVCKEKGMPPRCPGYWILSEDEPSDSCYYDGCRDTIIYNISSEDFHVIFNISEDVNFLEAMIKLKETDIIEYESRMSQFRSQVVEQKAAKQIAEGNSKPLCPHCNSTNIKSISGLNRGASIAMWGIFSKKINKSFECKNCGYTW